jgi:aminoglycoside/choline kinase family phosphotransferase
MSHSTPTTAAFAGASFLSLSTPVTWSDPRRQAAFAAWVDRLTGEHGLVAASLRPASADASFRRYLRIDAQPGAEVASRIIMDAPPDLENSAPFVHVAGVMAAAGLNVPQVLDWDTDQGFLLLSDLGSQTLMDVINPQDASANHALYLQALDALIAWQLASKPGVLPVYDEALLRRELALFPDWYLQQHRGVLLDSKMLATLEDAFSKIAADNLRAPSVFVHCDFMPRNLMLPASGVTSTPMGILDFQDATFGPITYDIASLMRDAFLSWDEDFVLDITVRYWEKARKAGLPVGQDFGEFYRAVEWMGLQRHLRIAGVFARLTLRDHKPKYLADAPRFIGYIRSTAARYRELKPLLRLVDQVEGIQAATGFAFGRV